jgi:geranylgeranyl pyrophosphate synthase
VSDAAEQTLSRWRAAIDRELAHVGNAFTALPDTLRNAVRYAATGEGKRMRGLLVMAAYQALDGTGDAIPLAAAVEVVHAYSLAHDDLPCMDDAELRRGRATTHRAFDVATATVAGVVMVPIAVHAIIHAARQLGLDDRRTNDIVETLMFASGASGMIGGQVMDLAGERRALSLDELERLHRAKTGALITASLLAGGIAARGDASRLRALVAAGDALGLAFQIADDILDATESSESLGKAAGQDVALAKSTYTTLLGVDSARAKVEALVRTAESELKEGRLDTPALRYLSHFVGARRS